MSCAALRLSLEPHGYRYPAGRRSAVVTPYEALTHVAESRRGLHLGTERGSLMLWRSAFPDPLRGPSELDAELRSRVAAGSAGVQRLLDFAALDALGRRRPRPGVAAWSFVALCVAAEILQRVDSFVPVAAAFSASLVAHGEWWRVVTGNFVHGMGLGGPPLHLLFNAFGVLALASLVEPLLGSGRSFVVMACAGLLAMAGGGLAGQELLVGGSGVVFGLAGAVLCLELHFPARVPASLRLPRGVLVVLLLLEGAIGFLLPFVSGSAHLAGFVGGYAATFGLARGALLGRPLRPAVRGAALLLASLVILAFAATAPLLLRQPEALVRTGERYLRVTRDLPLQWNEMAWRLATEAGGSPSQMATAVALAERACEVTERELPSLLDTLAEARFQAGDRAGALEAIDEALALIDGPAAPPWEGRRYYAEQRRRFTGERAADDRPPDPPGAWPGPSPTPPPAGAAERALPPADATL